MKVRYPTESELSLIEAEIDYFGADIKLEKNELLVVEGKFVEIFKTGETLANLALEKGETPIYAGVKIGEIVRKKCRASLEWGSILYHLSTKNRIELSGKSVSLFLYGRDVFKEHIPQKMNLGRKLVGTVDGEFMGFGIYNGKMLANVIDKGAYLRKYM